MRRRAVRWTYSEARVSDFWGLSSIGFGVITMDAAVIAERQETDGLAASGVLDASPIFSTTGTYPPGRTPSGNPRRPAWERERRLKIKNNGV